MRSQAIIEADYAEVTIPAESVSLVVTSPPYPGLRQCQMSHAQWVAWFRPLLAKMYTELTPAGVVCLNVNAARMGGGVSAEFWRDVMGLIVDQGWLLVDVYAWDKLNPPPSGAQRGGRRYDVAAWEPVLVLAKRGDYHYQGIRRAYRPKTQQRASSGVLRGCGVTGGYNGGHADLSQDGAYQTNVIRISPSGGKSARPRALGQSFPVELAWRMIQTFSRPGELVLDPFCGAGTTCYAARLLGRRWLGVEVDEGAVEQARGWLSAESSAAFSDG